MVEVGAPVEHALDLPPGTMLMVFVLLHVVDNLKRLHKYSTLRVPYGHV